MIFKFKVLELPYGSNIESKFLGMFGDCIKVKLNTEGLSVKDSLVTFLSYELTGSLKILNLHIIKKYIDKNIYEIDLPDLSYEIVISLL